MSKNTNKCKMRGCKNTAKIGQKYCRWHKRMNVIICSPISSVNEPLNKWANNEMGIDYDGYEGDK